MTPHSPDETPRVWVGPFRVVDLGRSQVVSHIASYAATGAAQLMSHLHVGSLNHWRDESFVAAINDSTVVYADGMATVVVAKSAGSRQIQRAGLTDIGEEIVAAVGDRLQRPVRVALVGGPSGLAARAARVLSERHGTETVYTDHGYHGDADWDPVLDQLRAARPDIVFVGLGMPSEAHWMQRHRESLPPALIIAAGGYFGHLVGDEHRAPEWAQRAGVEWVWRLAHDPKKLSRYASGIVTTGRLALRARRSVHR